MRLSRTLAGVSLGVVMALGGSLAVAPTASATGTHTSPPAHPALGTRSLAAVLLADKSGFDRNADDFDVLTAAVLAVLKAKPKSAVGVLTDGTVAVTAFLPNDRAFRTLVKDLTGKNIRDEKQVFNAVAGLGIDTVEAVLLYHVVPGATITSAQALKANGAVLTTALGSTIKVRVYRGPVISLWDKDRNSRNPRVILSQVDINKGNVQIAHGIDRVLRPVNLPN